MGEMLGYMRGTEGVTKGEKKTKAWERSEGSAGEGSVGNVWVWWKLIGVVRAESCHSNEPKTQLDYY